MYHATTNIDRLAFLCFLWDTQHAVLFSQSLCMSSFELRTTLPCNEATWEASSAEEWWYHAKKEPQISYLSVLKAYMNPDLETEMPQLNSFSRLLALHGLMSIQWDMKRRDQTSLGQMLAGSSERESWQHRLARSYDAWKADFDTYCMNVTLTLSNIPSRRAAFTRFSTATIAIYHAAHITLNVEILDLQIYAGARHIIGRPVTPADYERSRRLIKDWAKPESDGSSSNAVWHAACLLRDGIMNLEIWDVNDAFHYPWCLYLSTLTCWAFHFANVMDTNPLSSSSSSSLHRHFPTTTSRETPSTDTNPKPSSSSSEAINDACAKAEMTSLVSNMASVRPENLWRVIAKHSSKGLIAVIAKHLGNVRWAVVHEGMKVLRRLLLAEREAQ